MTALTRAKSVYICHGNKVAIEALRRAGVPLAVAQRTILSASWRQAHKEMVTELMKQMEKEMK